MEGNQQQKGYMVVFPEYEYAEIDGIYKRYSANVGYVFNTYLLEPSASMGYGWIDRYGTTSRSWSLSGWLSYGKKLKLSLMMQLTQRTDLKWLWGDSKASISGFFGLIYKI